MKLYLTIFFLLYAGAHGAVYGQRLDITAGKAAASQKASNSDETTDLADPKADTIRVLFLQAIDAKTETLQQVKNSEKQALLIEKASEIESLTWRGLKAISDEIFKPNASALATRAKKELLMGELGAASSLLKQLAAQQGSASLKQLQNAAKLAKQDGALWIARDTKQAITSFELAHSYQNDDLFVLDTLIRLYKIEGRNDLALKHAQTLVFFTEQLLDSVLANNNNNGQVCLSSSLNMLASMFLKRDQLDKAREAYLKSLEMREKLVANAPKNSAWQKDFEGIQWQQELSVSFDLLGYISQIQNQPDQALVYYEKRLAIATKLASKDSTNNLWARDVIISLEKIAAILDVNNPSTESNILYNKSLAIRGKPTTHETYYGWQLCQNINPLIAINIAKSEGKLDKALSHSQKNLSVFEKLAASDPNNALWQRDLSANLDNVAGILQMQGQLNQSLALYQKSLSIRENLAARDPKNNDWQANLIASYMQLASLHPSPVDTDLAKKYLSSALTIARKLETTGALPQDENARPSSLKNRLNDLN